MLQADRGERKRGIGVRYRMRGEKTSFVSVVQPALTGACMLSARAHKRQHPHKAAITTETH